MDFLKEILPTKLFDSLERAGICTKKQVITLSVWDISKLTGLHKHEVNLIRNTVAKHTTSQSFTCKKLLGGNDNKIISGCESIDNLMNGGFRRGVLYEIYGESGSGKTQLAMQVAAKYASEGSVYICTEDLFPITRYNQIEANVIGHSNYKSNMFVEHVYEATELLSCIRVRLPKLLQQHKVSVVIIDSVAAPFRCETTNYIQRAEELRELAILLLKVAQEYNFTVICINQVTANFHDSSSKLVPSLGLAWSNMVFCRLWLKKSTKNYSNEAKQNVISVREISVIFAPDLPNKTCDIVITGKGISDFKNNYLLHF